MLPNVERQEKAIFNPSDIYGKALLNINFRKSILTLRKYKKKHYIQKKKDNRKDSGSKDF